MFKPSKCINTFQDIGMYHSLVYLTISSEKNPITLYIRGFAHVNSRLGKRKKEKEPQILTNYTREAELFVALLRERKNYRLLFPFHREKETCE